MTNAQIVVKLELSLSEAEALRKLIRRSPKGQLDVLHNQLVDAMNLAAEVL